MLSFCPRCGAQITVSGAQFCMKCGARLPDEAALNTPTPAVSPAPSPAPAMTPSAANVQEAPPAKRSINYVSIALAVVLTFVLYYILESIYLIVGDLMVGAIRFEQSGMVTLRVLLFPVAGYLVFRAMWKHIRNER